MRTLIMSVVIALAVVSLSACGGGSHSQSSQNGSSVDGADADQPMWRTNFNMAGSDYQTPVAGKNMKVTRREDGRFEIAVYNPQLVVEGVKDSNFPASKMRLLSAYQESINSNPFIGGWYPVREGKVREARFAVVDLGKLAKKAKRNVAISENLWVMGSTNSTFLVLNPNDPWVVYELNDDGTINYDTLAIGMVFYNGRLYPTRPLLKALADRGQLSAGETKLPEGELPWNTKVFAQIDSFVRYVE